MIVNGKAIRDEIRKQLTARIAIQVTNPKLLIVACEPNFETETFIRLKTSFAESIGVRVERIDVTPNITLSTLQAKVFEKLPSVDGIIMQVPFPHIETSEALSLVPVSHDVDVVRYNGKNTNILPPVVGAIHHIATYYNISWQEKNVVIVGKGRLVGQPMMHYVQAQTEKVSVIEKTTKNANEIIKNADILVLGAGVPSLVTAGMVKDGVIVFDAGTSEEGGVLRGDADPDVAEKASIFTPVPGGIGPVTVAVIFENLLTLIDRRK